MRMKVVAVVGAVFVGAFSSVGAEAPAAHPRLMADAARFAHVRTELSKGRIGPMAVRRVLESADRLAADPKPVPYRLHGKRLVSCGDYQAAALTLAFAWRWTGERKYARAAIDRTLFVCRDWPDFHPSHFLDTAITGFGVAIVYDWCYDVLSAEERGVIERGLDARALVPAITPKQPWSNNFFRVSNWNQVCNGGMLACAAVVRDVFPEHAEVVRRQALKGLPNALGVYAPDGCWPEGPGYWDFAMTYTAIAFEALEAGWGSTFGLDRLPGLEKAVDYQDAMTGPEGLVFNHGDNGLRRTTRFGVWYLASRYDRPEALVNFESRIFAENLEAEAVGSRFVLSMLHYRDVGPGVGALPLCCAMTNATMGIVSQRNAWKPGAWFAALRAGSTEAGHSHLDIGSFVLDAKGTRWAHDLGNEAYAKVELAHVDLWGKGQDAERWKLFRYSSEGHNTVTINGHPLLVEQYAPVTSFRAGFPSVATIDLSPVLSDAPKATRTATMLREGGWELADSFGGVRPGKMLEWRMNTDAAISTDGPVAKLTKTVSGAPVTLTVTISGVKAGWEVRDISKPPHPCDKDNPGMRQLFFRTAVPKNGAVDYVVRFR